MPLRVRAWAVACAIVCTLAPPAHSDDVADEADLQFQIGADRYRQTDYQGALEHFLASNRLVANRNVRYNIARCYEQLKRFPEAYRYYAQALEGEDSPSARARVEASLEQIKPHVALLEIATDPPGATIYIGRRDLGSRGESPRALGLAPGRYRVMVEKAGYLPAQSEEILVAAAEQVRVDLKLERRSEQRTGTLVVDSDVPGALIEVDRKPTSFTPAILTLPSGSHAIRVSLKGYRTVVERVEVGANLERRLDLALTQTEEVTAASRSSETVDEAPASVSIVRSEELRGMAYPTIVEALRGVRGMYVWDDHSYTSVGFRGMGRLGGYSNRLLVLLDGQPTNDDWLGSSYTGYDARTDLEDIERVEVIRGPGSVLYGTNAFSGVVNLVSRGVGDKSEPEIGVSANAYGVARGRARYAMRLSDTATVWASASAAHASGRDFYFPEYAQAGGPELAGNARGLDGFQSGTLQGRATWGAFTTQWFLHSRDKHSPTAEYNATFGDARFHQVDTRGLVEARFEPVVAKGVQLLSRMHYNLYSFRGYFPRSEGDGGLETDGYESNWLGLEQRIALTLAPQVRLTAGAELQFHNGVHQTVADERRSYLDERKPFDTQAGYVLTDVGLSHRLRVSGGVRLDHYSTFGSSVNPRVGLVLEPYENGIVKLLVGKAFRAPSIYELYYNDGGFTQLPNPGLSPESIYSSELEYSHRFSPSVVATVSAYGNLVTNLIVLRGSDVVQYENSRAPQATLGGELELRREWREGWMLAGSYSTQHSWYLPDSPNVSDFMSGRTNEGLRQVENAPEHLASVKGAVPVLGRGLRASTRVSFEGPRWDRHELSSDPVAQSKTEAAVIWDVVFSGEEQHWKLGYAIGVYNAFDWRYTAPVSSEYRQHTIVQNGRTFLASANVRF